MIYMKYDIYDIYMNIYGDISYMIYTDIGKGDDLG